jgi:hypothetical protein
LPAFTVVSLVSILEVILKDSSNLKLLIMDEKILYVAIGGAISLVGVIVSKIFDLRFKRIESRQEQEKDFRLLDGELAKTYAKRKFEVGENLVESSIEVHRLYSDLGDCYRTLKETTSEQEIERTLHRLANIDGAIRKSFENPNAVRIGITLLYFSFDPATFLSHPTTEKFVESNKSMMKSVENKDSQGISENLEEILSSIEDTKNLLLQNIFLVRNELKGLHGASSISKLQ